MSENLAEVFVREQERCRQLLTQYAEVANLPNVNVTFAVAMINEGLRQADRASVSGDVVEMLRALEVMKGFE